MALASALAHPSTKYWQLKQCRLCGIPFDPHAEHPPPRLPRHCVKPHASSDPTDWQCPYCVVVHRENEEFPITLKGESLRHVVSNAEQRSRRVGVLSNQNLVGAPFTAVPEQKPILKEVMRVQRAVEWLMECPLLTLRVLQQRVLCASETYFKTFMGIPPYLKPVDAPPTPKSKDSMLGSDDDEGLPAASTAKEPEFIGPPQPLTFSKFMSDFLVVEYNKETEETILSLSHTHSDDALRFSSGALHNAVLATGRPMPVAPVSSTNLVYGPQEEALRMSAAGSKRGEAGFRKQTQATTTLSVDRDQPTMAEVMHWSNFFHKCFDEMKEGQCRDPIFLFAAILIACSHAGRYVLDNSSEALIEKEIERQCLQHPSTRCTTCSACARVREMIKEYWRYQLNRSSLLASPVCDEAKGIRFFLGTPAVVWWAVTFLQLYRTSTSTVWKKEEGGAQHGDTIRPGEVYTIRDWIAKQAEVDEKAFEAQRRIGSILIPSSCSTNAKAYRIGFTKENVARALSHISQWVDEKVQNGEALEVKALKELLKTEFPVMAYYTTYFDPPVTCRHTRRRQPKHWAFGKGVVIKDPAVCE